MKKHGWSSGKFIVFFAAMVMLLFSGVSYAQIEGLEDVGPLGEKQDTVKCRPDTLTTAYDKFQSDSVDAQQLGMWYSFAREEYKYKNYQRAIPYYWKVLVNDTTGKFKVVYSKLADCYYNLNEPDSVLLVAYRGLDKYPDNIRLHYWASFVHDLLNQTACAIPHYEVMVKANPDEKSYWVKLAYLYYKEDNPKAIEAQQKVVNLDPKDVEASRLLAEIMEHFGEDPLKAREQAYKNDPTNVDNAMNFGKAAFERGLYKEAIAPFKSILQVEPKNTTALQYLGRSYEGLNQFSDALKNYKEILEIEPKNVNVMCLIASVYGRLHQFTTARSYVNKAERIDPGNGMPHMVMSEIYENAVTYCSEQRKERSFDYEDKVVYYLAQQELKQAAKDPNVSSQAQQRIKQLDPLTPTTEDLFMHDNRLEPRGECYSWIK